jgi:hypothetical protein
MDPWLEEARIFQDLRFTLTVRLSAALNAALSEKYYSRVSHTQQHGDPLVEVWTVEREGNLRLTAIEIPDRREHWREHQTANRPLAGRIVIRLFRDPPVGHSGASSGLEILTQRFGDPEYTEIEAIDYRQPLPSVRVPLLPGEPDIVVALQPLLNETYDLANYSRRVRYERRQPDPPLTAEQQAWADGILRSRGLIPTANGGAT